MNGTSARVAKTPNQSLFPLDFHTFSGDKPLTTVDDQSTIDCLYLSYFLTLFLGLLWCINNLSFAGAQILYIHLSALPIPSGHLGTLLFKVA